MKTKSLLLIILFIGFTGCTFKSMNVTAFGPRRHIQYKEKGSPNNVALDVPWDIEQARAQILLIAMEMGFKEYDVQETGPDFIFLARPKTGIIVLGGLGISKHYTNSMAVFLEAKDGEEGVSLVINEIKYEPLTPTYRYKVVEFLQERIE